MLFAMGAGPRVIGVGNFDRYPPEALTRTKVGGLIDPDIERIISLKPDLVDRVRDSDRPADADGARRDSRLSLSTRRPCGHHGNHSRRWASASAA